MTIGSQEHIATQAPENSPPQCGPFQELRGRRLLMVAHANSAHTGRWAKYFHEYQKMEVRVISPIADAVAGINVRRFPASRCWYHRLRGLHLYLDYPQWRSIFREFRPDITHVHYPDGGGRYRFYFHGIAPLVTSTWGSEVVESPEFPLGRKHKEGVRRILRKSNAVTATTRFLGEWTARYCPPGTPIHLIPFGVDCEQFKPDPSLLALRPYGEVRLGFFKNLERKYGPEVLVEAFAKISARAPRATLVMCGKGDMTEALKARAAALGLSDKISFPGRLPHDQVVRAMQACAVVVMPSTCQESFGVAAIEASACEIPVVATNVGGVSEAVVDGQTGLLVAAHDVDALAGACLRLIGDPARRRLLGKAGRKFVLDHYQWHANAATMALIYTQILRGIAPKTPNMILSGSRALN